MDPQILREAMTAYQAVYDEDLRETIEFENWVNALLDEGYDLSDYTWEDMYEAYIEEGLLGDVWANRNKIGSAVKGAVSGVNRAASSVNRQIGNTVNQTGANIRNVGSAVKNAVTSAPARAAASGFGSSGLVGAVTSAVQSSRQQKPTAPSQTAKPPMPGLPANYRGQELQQAARARASQVGTSRQGTAGGPTVGGNTPIGPGNTPAKPTATAAPRPTATAAPRPTATAAPRPGTTPGSPKPGPTATATATPKPRPKDTSITDMIGRSQVRQGAPINTGNKSSDIRSMATRGSLGATPPTSATKPTPSRPMGSRKPGSIVSGFDMFDVVKGHLLDEGYADTEEAALAIMANMSEEWKQSIVEAYGSFGANMAGAELQRRLEQKVRADERKKIEQEKSGGSGASSQVKGA